jgi:hypothetical protein
MRRFGCLLLLILPAVSQSAAGPRPAPLALTDPLIDKSFYALVLLERDASVRTALDREPQLRALSDGKMQQIAAAAEHCQGCGAMGRFDDAEISTVAKILRRLYATEEPVRRLVDGPLRESGVAVRYHGVAGGDLLAHAWEDAANGINHVIDVYGTGTALPYSSEVDGPSFDLESPGYGATLEAAAQLILEKKDQLRAFFAPSLAVVGALLDINKRDEAGRHEPLEQGENRAAVAAIATLEWQRYPYSVIVVPGVGNDRLTFSISPIGKMDAELAALRWREGKAPLILVSGGYVHPNQTPFAEAIEMKRVLVRDYHVPEQAILIDPHARHTTTNLRNAARLMWRYGLPFERKGLITASQSQVAYIESAEFRERCKTELGYEPVSIGKRTSRVDLEFIPNMYSLQADPKNDPLDP